MGRISFSIDIDWVNDFVLEDTLQLFIDNNVKCTLFATHETEVLKNIDSELFEIAIHPNFNPLLNLKGNKTVDELIDELKNLFPDSIGIRSHSLVNSTYLFDKFHEKGFLYESNLLLPYQNQITPFPLWNGLLRIPFNWEDDIHCMYNKSFESMGIEWDSDIILNIHPIHLFLNTESLERYHGIREYYKDTSQLKKAINTDSPGVRDLVIDCIKKAKEDSVEVLRLDERYNLFVNEDKFG